MAHLRKDATSGHLLRLPVSKHLTHGPRCDACPECVDSDTMEVSLGGLTRCSGCFPITYPMSARWLAAPTQLPDGLITLTRSACACFWTVSLRCDFNVAIWYSPGCPGSRDETNTNTGWLTIELQVGAADRTLTAWYLMPRGYYSPARLEVFRLVEPATTCAAGGGNNEYDSYCDASYWGGAATIALP